VDHPPRIDRPREESKRRQTPHQLRLGFETEQIPDRLPKRALETSLILLARLLVEVVDSERRTGGREEGREDG